MLREPEQAVKLNPLLDYIDGQVVAPIDKLPASISNPNTNEPLQQQRSTDPAHVEQALASAHHLHTSNDWHRVSPADKAQILKTIATELEGRLDEIALVESLTTGIVIRQTRTLARQIPLVFHQAARQLQQATESSALSDNVHLARVPWGPAALLVPWSGAAATAAHKIASALAAGCPVILKPSEWSPHSCGILADVIAGAGLPAGTFQLVNGGTDVGMTLVADSRIKAVSFSGNLDSGHAIARTCLKTLKPLQMELGGMNPLLVLSDADLDLAVEGIMTGQTALNGQWCRGVGRLLIHVKHYHALLKQLMARLESVTIGHSLSPESDMGPLINPRHQQQVQSIIDHLLGGGGVLHELAHLPDLPGYFMPPTLVTNCHPSVSLGEMFGPVTAVHFFKSDAEAIALANQPESALAAYIFSRDPDHALAVAQQIQASSVSINGVSMLGVHPLAPRSGWGLSGLGAAGAAETFRFFSGTRAIGIASG